MATTSWMISEYTSGSTSGTNMYPIACMRLSTPYIYKQITAISLSIGAYSVRTPNISSSATANGFLQLYAGSEPTRPAVLIASFGSKTNSIVHNRRTGSGYDGGRITGTISNATGFNSQNYLIIYVVFPSYTSITINNEGNNAFSCTVTIEDQTWTLTTAVSPANTGTVTAGGSLTRNATKSLTGSPSAGYKFSSWSKTAGTLSTTTAATTTFTMGTSNATVTANFAKQSYTLTTAVSPSGGGTVTSGATIEYGSTKSLTATANAGYSFSSWSKTAGSLSSTTSNPTTFTMGTSAATVTANFTKNSYTLTTAVSPSGGGTVTQGGSIEYGSTKSLTATPATGYEFVSWSKTSGTLSSTTTNPTTFTMGTSAATVTATFQKANYALTGVADPSGTGTVTFGSNTAQMGDTVTITATPATGYLFDYYTSSPSVTITNNQFIMPASAVTITAHFKVGASTCSLDKSSYYGGETATLTINSNSNTYTHKYELNFGLGMSTGLVNVAAGITSVPIYLPVEWASHLMSGTSATTSLTLYTYNGETLLGSNTIENITYNALDGIIPSFNVWRAKNNAAFIEGTTAAYSVIMPNSIDEYQIIAENETKTSSAASGSLTNTYPTSTNHLFTCRMVYDEEIIDLVRDIPMVVKKNKLF